MSLLGWKLKLDGIARPSCNSNWIADSNDIWEETHEVVGMYASTIAMHVCNQNDLFVVEVCLSVFVQYGFCEFSIERSDIVL